MRRAGMLLVALAAVLAAPAAAHAFCGFYVSGAGGDLFNNATQVVLMRKGTRTVLSMQNNYQGPPQDFAMVVPVPVVLQKENVKTLPREIFRKVDQLAAPRLVEYWEQDPCRPQIAYGAMGKGFGSGVGRARAESRSKDLGVTVEARFAVGEYQIVILSARDSTGLDTWLREEKYAIPEGAEPYLKPYVEGGSKFFVAKVDASKVKFENGQAMLSPLRFHYDAESFNLPIRLGMMNSAGTQDLIVHILAPGQRYEVANYPNVTIPTNLDVKEEARDRFGEFYAALFDRTLETNPGAVVTEYAWDAGSCDPCPTPPLDPGALATLGGDVLGAGGAASARGRVMMPMYGFVLTRLHMRYGKDGINEDLVFKAAPPIAGGREWRGEGGKLEEGKVAAPINNFQGRYAIRHEWTGPIACEHPVRGVWGGPPSGQASSRPRPALDLAFVPRGQTQLASILRQDVPEIGITAARAPSEAPPPADPSAVTQALNDPGQNPSADQPRQPVRKDRQGCAAGGPAGAGAALGLLLALAGLRRRRAA
jgi:uncharacterized protein (TIGR03382 family)